MPVKAGSDAWPESTSQRQAVAERLDPVGPAEWEIP
jgi:hypothetical protein